MEFQFLGIAAIEYGLKLQISQILLLKVCDIFDYNQVSMIE